MANTSPGSSALPDALVTWVEGQVDGQVLNAERQVRWREQWFIDVEREGEVRKLLARFGRSRQDVEASNMLTHFDIPHEAQVLEALQGYGLKVPEFLGYNSEFRMILMSRLSGTNMLASAPDDETRKSVMFEYYDQLARLHSLDIGKMHLQSIEVPKTPEEIAFKGKFRFAEADYVGLRDSIRPEPLFDLAIWWLHNNVPQDSRVSFLQGDTGPGQFMFAEGHLTGLIDWELAHVGSPMLDLGVARMRNMLYPTGSLKDPFAHYEDVSGNEIDWNALSFYTIESMLLTPLSMARILQWPSARTELTMPGYGWDVTLRRGLCDAMAEAVGIEIDPPDLPSWEVGRPTGLADFLVEHLELHCLPVAADAAGRNRIETAVAVAKTLQLESYVGSGLLADDLDDMGSVLGARPSTRDEGLARLRDFVSVDPERHLVELIRMFSRIERRREYLMRPVMTAQDSAPFERLRPAGF